MKRKVLMNKTVHVLFLMLGITGSELTYSQNLNSLNELKFGMVQGCKERQSKNIDGIHLVDEYLTSMCECTSSKIIESLFMDVNFSKAIKSQDFELIGRAVKSIPIDHTRRMQLACAESSLKKFGSLSNIIIVKKEELEDHATRSKSGGETALKKRIYDSCYLGESMQKVNSQEFCTCVAAEAYKKITITSLFSGDSSPMIEATKFCKAKVK